MGLHRQFGTIEIELCMSPQVKSLIIFGVLQRNIFLNSKSASKACAQSLSRSEGKWLVPPPGVFKINIDGATSDGEKNSSVGVVIRDSVGNIVATCCKYLQGQYLVEEVEALAMECGLLLAKEQKLS